MSCEQSGQDKDQKTLETIVLFDLCLENSIWRAASTERARGSYKLSLLTVQYIVRPEKKSCHQGFRCQSFPLQTPSKNRYFAVCLSLRFTPGLQQEVVGIRSFFILAIHSSFETLYLGPVIAHRVLAIDRFCLIEAWFGLISAPHVFIFGSSEIHLLTFCARWLE